MRKGLSPSLTPEFYRFISDGRQGQEKLRQSIVHVLHGHEHAWLRRVDGQSEAGVHVPVRQLCCCSNSCGRRNSRCTCCEHWEIRFRGASNCKAGQTDCSCLNNAE